MEVLQFCVRHDIYLVGFPSNSTWLLQPQDLAVFAAFKKYAAKFRLNFARTTPLSNANIVRPLSVALLLSHTNHNIAGGFAKAGILPWNPKISLSRVAKQKQTVVPTATLAFAPSIPKAAPFASLASGSGLLEPNCVAISEIPDSQIGWDTVQRPPCLSSEPRPKLTKTERLNTRCAVVLYRGQRYEYGPQILHALDQLGETPPPFSMFYRVAPLRAAAARPEASLDFSDLLTLPNIVISSKARAKVYTNARLLTEQGVLKAFMTAPTEIAEMTVKQLKLELKDKWKIKWPSNSKRDDIGISVCSRDRLLQF